MKFQIDFWRILFVEIFVFIILIMGVCSLVFVKNTVESRLISISFIVFMTPVFMMCSYFLYQMWKKKTKTLHF